MKAAFGDRSLFPELEAVAYLNHAGISPPSRAVRDAVTGMLDDYGRRGATAFPTWIEQRKRLKTKLAGWLGASPDDLGLVQSTTRGVNDVALCFPWKKEDRIVLFEGEFPANVTPWQRAAELFGLETVFLRAADFLESEELGLEKLRAELERGVRLVAVSAVEFQTGLAMPVERMAELCHAASAEILVDAVQACGSKPVSVGSIDYLACGSHKWLMGVEGAGFLYVSPKRIDALRPSVAGWLSHETPLSFLLEGPGHLRYDRPIRQTADFVEGGNLNAAGFVALEASVDILTELGLSNVFEHANAYLDVLEPALLERGFTSFRQREPARRSGMLCVLPPAGVSVVAIHQELGRRGIATATPDGSLRMSPHWPNSLEEVPTVIAAFDASLAALRG